MGDERRHVNEQEQERGRRAPLGAAARQAFGVQRRSPAAVAVSILLHVVAGTLILLLFDRTFPIIPWPDRTPLAVPVERLSFVRVQVPDEGVDRPGVSGGDGRPETPVVERPPLVVPVETPAEIPAAPAVAVPTDETGTGPLVGRGGPTRGVTPTYTGPRVWAAPGPVAAAPRSTAEYLDSAIVARILKVRDSIAVATGRSPTDWTTTRNGRRYGINDDGLHLGGITIPRFLLPTFGKNTPLSPTQQRELAISMNSREIREHAQRAMNEDEFRDAVKRIRERKEREREMERRRGTVAENN